MLTQQLCLVQTAIFPGIMKANENPFFWQDESIDLYSVDLRTIYKFTKYVNLWTAIVISLHPFSKNRKETDQILIYRILHVHLHVISSSCKHVRIVNTPLHPTFIS